MQTFSQPRKPVRPIKLAEIEFAPELFKELELDKPNTRQKRREIARKCKIDWKVYQYLEKEIMRRKKNNLNLLDGKENENGQRD